MQYKWPKVRMKICPLEIAGVELLGSPSSLRAISSRASLSLAWVRGFFQALQPLQEGGVYVNFLDGDDDARRVREAYGAATYRRLAEIKAAYDPDNAFHHNKNIGPA